LQVLRKIKTVPLYLQYFLNVVDRHSLQSPFIFNFYDDLRKSVSENKGIAQVESVRKELIKNRSAVGGTDLGAGSHISKSTDSSTISDIAQNGISSKKECIFLFEIAKVINPKICVELGTSLGIATAYLCRAADSGEVITFEGNESLVKTAKELLKKLHCENIQIIQGNIDDRLPEFLVKAEKIDLAVIDANHTEKALISYFDMLKVKMVPGGMVVIDDIRWSNEMYRGWKKVHADRRVSLSIEFMHKGLLIFDSNIRKQHYVLSL
jgi:predicted O-methyltransferase YrrM